jgi:hypothetical protein
MTPAKNKDWNRFNIGAQTEKARKRIAQRFPSGKRSKFTIFRQEEKNQHRWRTIAI